MSMMVFPVLGHKEPVDFKIRKRNGVWSVYILDKWVTPIKDGDSGRSYWVWINNTDSLKKAVDYVYTTWIGFYRKDPENAKEAAKIQ